MARRGCVPHSRWLVALLGGIACSQRAAPAARTEEFSFVLASGVPHVPAPTPLGYVCRENGAARRCTPRSREAGEFECRGDRCVQRHVRLPDDGEWRCAEREGVVWCAGGEPAAGVVAIASERGYRCGERRKSDRGRKERVCVDTAPDYPFGRAGEFACRFSERGSLSRECVRDVTVVRATTQTGAPNCWLDADCDGARCDRGVCTGEVP